MAGRTMTIEPVAPFNGLDVLVAREEGLFAAEGLDLRIASPAPSDRAAATENGTRTRPATGQGRLMERGEAVMFQA
jgi:hypothetical protein